MLQSETIYPILARDAECLKRAIAPWWWNTVHATVDMAVIDRSAPRGTSAAHRGDRMTTRLPRLVLRQAADEYARARGRADRGRVLVGVLAQLGANACLLDRVLAAGACAG